MTRCTAKASDGRRCALPEHQGKHLVIREPMSSATALRVAHAWGWRGRMAESAARTASTVDQLLVLLDARSPLR